MTIIFVPFRPNCVTWRDLAYFGKTERGIALQHWGIKGLLFFITNILGYYLPTWGDLSVRDFVFDFIYIVS